MTQTDIIAERLLEHGQIDNFYAIREMNPPILRLGARIHDLRDRGWEIATEELPNKNTVYKLVKAPALKPVAMAI